MVLLIDPSDIAQVQLTPREVIDAVESAYRQDGKGLAEETPRLEIKIKGKDLPHIAPGTTSVGQGMAYLEESKVFILSYTFHFDFHKYISEIIDPETGKTLAIIKRTRGAFGTKPGQIDSGMLRTGAAAAIGAKYMSNKDIDAVGIIGTGRIGRGSLACLAEELKFDNVYTHSGRRKDDAFTQVMSEHVDAEITALDSVKEVMARSNVLVTATYAQEAVVKGKWLREGTHISGMGADGPKKAEMDTEVFRRASRIVVDSDKCLTIGEIAAALESGAITQRDIQGKIGHVVAGKITGRDNTEDITVFESDGTHIQSGAVVNLIYQKVKKMGLGREIDDVSDFFINP
jgi:ornithine cyclodeaminase/alanine dehydrogenase-like protein (mu-crystallin family)